MPAPPARRSALGLLTTVALAACGMEPPPQGPADVEGTITSVREVTGGTRVLIEEEPGPIDRTGGAKFELAVDDRTPVYLRMEDGSLRRASPAILREGQRARGWVSGMVRESYPAQAAAAAIVLLAPAPEAAAPPPPPPSLGPGTFAGEEQERVVLALEHLLGHSSELCAELGRAAWHRWQEGLVSNGRETALCPSGRYGYMSRALGETYLCAAAFRNHHQLVETLAHEERHHRGDRHRHPGEWTYLCGFSE